MDLNTWEDAQSYSYFRKCKLALQWDAVFHWSDTKIKKKLGDILLEV